MSNYKLVALDLDGTLFNNQSKITEDNINEIRRVSEQGVHVVISTGRPYCGIPFTQIEGTGIEYAITTNGSSVYHIPDQKCIYENSMEPDMVLPIMDYLLSKNIHFDVFINGDAFSPEKCVTVGQNLAVPESLKNYILNSRKRISDMPAYIRKNNLRVQKITMNFQKDENGILVDREEIKTYFDSRTDVTCVCGGYNNLEFTKRGADKGNGLRQLAQYLDVPVADTIAIGDTENDLAIIQAAGVGIAMGNATDAVKAASDDITLSNEESGVAAALRKYFPE
ncbi:MAG: Cof-type HAD-IIB family hydrolase [Agathobacter sp.]|nr:Cof-type HAD-IIB family hydrolase [Agathobacter sp.]